MELGLWSLLQRAMVTTDAQFPWITTIHATVPHHVNTDVNSGGSSATHKKKGDNRSTTTDGQILWVACVYPWQCSEANCSCSAYVPTASRLDEGLCCRVLAAVRFIRLSRTSQTETVHCHMTREQSQSTWDRLGMQRHCPSRQHAGNTHPSPHQGPGLANGLFQNFFGFLCELLTLSHGIWWLNSLCGSSSREVFHLPLKFSVTGFAF